MYNCGDLLHGSSTLCIIAEICYTVLLHYVLLRLFVCFKETMLIFLHVRTQNHLNLCLGLKEYHSYMKSAVHFSVSVYKMLPFFFFFYSITMEWKKEGKKQ